MGNFGIMPLGKIDSAYVWRHGSREMAEQAAKELTSMYKTDVIVFEIIGTFENRIQYTTIK